MKIEILLSTMFFERETAETFLDNLNLETDIIIGNQSDYNENKCFEYKSHKVTVISRAERGVGKNRNSCLFFSTADIIIFADNDVVYDSGYREKIDKYYKENPYADVVIFNFKEKRGDELLHDINKKNKKATLRDVTKFGTWAITARRNSILKSRISFSLLFGGGAKYGSGEDSLFLIDCYKKGLKIYLSNITLGTVIHKESTWYKGVNEKYIVDKGAFFKALFPKTYRVFIFRHVIKHKRLYKEFGNLREVKRLMYKGAKTYQEN